MRFGVCGTFDKLDMVARAGYDYFEGMLSAIEKMSEEEYEALFKKVQASPICIEVVNCFYPGSLRLVGPERDMQAITSYTQRALSRASRLGAKVAVLGSSGARMIPDGYDRETAHAEFAEVLQMCGEVAASLDMVVVIEPLCRTEVNLINTVAEGLEMCQRVNHPHVKCLADFYHLSDNGETLDAVREAGDMLAHTHIARPVDHKMPSTEADIALCREWADALKVCGYDSRMSLEGVMEPEKYEEIIRTTRRILNVFCA